MNVNSIKVRPRQHAGGVFLMYFFESLHRGVHDAAFVSVLPCTTDEIRGFWLPRCSIHTDDSQDA